MLACMGARESSEVEHLRAALRDPSRLPRDRASAEARHLLFGHVLERVAEALEEADREVLLVKGAALAQTVYPEPWQREMVDVDLIARPGELPDILSALERGGFSIVPAPEGQHRSRAQIGERCAAIRVGEDDVMVEIHARLDKIVGRPVDIADLFRRASPSPSRRLLLPERIDHILLVVIHLSNADFDHDVGWIDLHLLIGDDLDWDNLTERVRAADLSTATWLSLLTLEVLGSSAIPPRVLRALEPPALRRRALERRFRPGAFPVRPPTDPPIGWSWMIAQTPLRDDLANWATGIARYAGTRAVERLAARFR